MAGGSLRAIPLLSSPLLSSPLLLLLLLFFSCFARDACAEGEGREGYRSGREVLFRAGETSGEEGKGEENESMTRRGGGEGRRDESMTRRGRGNRGKRVGPGEMIRGEGGKGNRIRRKGDNFLLNYHTCRELVSRLLAEERHRLSASRRLLRTNRISCEEGKKRKEGKDKRRTSKRRGAERRRRGEGRGGEEEGDLVTSVCSIQTAGEG
eukprot:746522-Hanusia_phi.AAC.18